MKLTWLDGGIWVSISCWSFSRWALNWCSGELSFDHQGGGVLTGDLRTQDWASLGLTYLHGKMRQPGRGIKGCPVFPHLRTCCDFVDLWLPTLVPILQLLWGREQSKCWPMKMRRSSWGVSQAQYVWDLSSVSGSQVPPLPLSECSSLRPPTRWGIKPESTTPRVCSDGSLRADIWALSLLPQSTS